MSASQCKCKYYSICKHRRQELPCTIDEAAEEYCKIYRLFRDVEVKATGHALTS